MSIFKSTDENLEKIFKRISKNDNECFVWQGGNSGTKGRGQGYGRMRFKGKVSAVHRVVYQLTKGNIPKDYQIDHLCKNRLCCNPDHLECVTAEENQRRKYI